MKQRVETYEELEVYKLAFALQQRVFELSKAWPREERYSLTDQARRASRSVGANISESWAKRRYEAHFVAKLTDSDGELNETRHWLRSAEACAYLLSEDAKELRDRCDSIGKKLGSMIKHASSWVIAG